MRLQLYLEMLSHVEDPEIADKQVTFLADSIRKAHVVPVQIVNFPISIKELLHRSSSNLSIHLNINLRSIRGRPLPCLMEHGTIMPQGISRRSCIPERQLSIKVRLDLSAVADSSVEEALPHAHARH